MMRTTSAGSRASRAATCRPAGLTASSSGAPTSPSKWQRLLKKWSGDQALRMPLHAERYLCLTFKAILKQTHFLLGVVGPKVFTLVKAVGLEALKQPSGLVHIVRPSGLRSGDKAHCTGPIARTWSRHRSGISTGGVMPLSKLYVGEQ